MNRDLAWGVEECKDWLDANPTQSDSSFTDDQIKRALNAAYREEINKAKTEASLLFFYKIFSFTWPASEPTYSIAGTPLANMDLYAFQDITQGEHRPVDMRILWRDKDTLFWGDAQGPTSARTIRVIYVAAPEDLVNDADEPSLVDYNYRDLWPLSAAIRLRDKSYEGSPGAWLSRLNNERLVWYKFMQARPREDVARVKSITLTDGIDFGRYQWDRYM